MFQQTSQPGVQAPMQVYSWIYARKDEAINYPIAPGNMMVFKDPDGKHYYQKSLGFSSFDRPTFDTYTLEEPVVQNVVEEPKMESQYNDIESLKAMIFDLSNQVSRLNDQIKNNQSKPKYYNQNKKGDGE